MLKRKELSRISIQGENIMSNYADDSSLQPDNITSFSCQADIKRQAGQWLVRIDNGELSDDDVRELQCWAATSDFHREYLYKLSRNWDAMETLEILADLFPLPNSESKQNAVTKHQQKNTNKKEPAFFVGLLGALRLPLFVSATVVVCVFIAMMILQPAPAIKQSFHTVVGEQKVQILEDGSRLTLNTNSRVDVDYTKARRVVSILRGEVNFEVAENKERPFVVYAGEGLVWAVGTAFNVRLVAGRVDVIVTEGTVKVFTGIKPDSPEPDLFVDLAAAVPEHIDPNESLLKAGEGLQYSQVVGVVAPVEVEQIEKKLAWHKGALVFKGETLTEALEEISRYTDKKLVIVDPSIAGIHVGGHYKTNDIDKLLFALSVGFDLEMKYVNSKLIHVSAM